VKSLHMEHTQVAATKTVSEIQQVLAASGLVRSVNIRYLGSRIEGVAFSIEIAGSEVSFLLPARAEPIFRILNGRRSGFRGGGVAAKDREQADRVAWRQILRWVQAQLAIIETGMVSASEAFLGYALVAPGESLHERFIQYTEHRVALPAPEYSAGREGE